MTLPLSSATPSPAAPAPPLLWQRLGLESTLEQVLPELIQLRRHLHRHPELSGHEQQTAALVAGQLRQWGWQVREGVGRAGVVAELGPGSSFGEIALLRNVKRTATVTAVGELTTFAISRQDFTIFVAGHASAAAAVADVAHERALADERHGSC